MKNKIITISRQFGSGGSIIAKKLGEKLNIPVYDDNILEMIAEDVGFNIDYVKDIVEKLKTGTHLEFASSFGLSVNTMLGNFDINEEEIYESQTNIILNLAKKESCIIVGRCSDYILKDFENVLHAFVYADLDVRKKRAVEEYEINTEDIGQYIKRQDKYRQKYYTYYCDRKWQEKENYNILLDSGKFSIDDCVDILTNIYNK